MWLLIAVSVLELGTHIG